jgi:hypothetical protein
MKWKLTEENETKQTEENDTKTDRRK